VPETQVQPEPAQGAQAGGQPVDLQVPVERLLARAARRLALGVEAVGLLGDRALQALRDGREVPLVVGDQRRVGLGGEMVGKIECAGGQGSSPRSLGSELASVRPHPGLAASPPVRYTLEVERSGLLSFLISACWSARTASRGSLPAP
jgi:hypothetical protein